MKVRRVLEGRKTFIEHGLKHIHEILENPLTAKGIADSQLQAAAS